MSTVTVDADYDGYVENTEGTLFLKFANPNDILIGYETDKSWLIRRGFFRYALPDEIAGKTVTQVRRRVNCNLAGGASHRIDDHAYGTNGQENPEVDSDETCYGRCTSGNLYSDDSNDLTSTGVKWRTLGGSVCQDVMNAKAASKPFALAIHEEGDNDPYGQVDGHSKSGGTPPQLEITYEEEAPPAGGILAQIM